MPMTQDEMVKLLKKYGFILQKGGKGSHVKMTKSGQFRPIIIPKGELNKFTEKGILKDAGLL
jgi:YcfA-like protein.